MNFSTRLSTFFLEGIFGLQKRLIDLQNTGLTGMFCLLLLGFLVGNFFFTFLNKIRFYLSWDGFIVFFLLVGMEIISYLKYHSKERGFLFLLPPIKKNFVLWRFANTFKVGVMIGFFVDAFKVGS